MLGFRWWGMCKVEFTVFNNYLQIGKCSLGALMDAQSKIRL